MNPMRAADYFRLITLAAIWGASFLFVRLTIGALGPEWLTAYRVGIAALVMLSITLLRGLAFDWRTHWRAYLVMGLGNAALPWLLYAWSGQYLSAGTMAILNATTPFFGAICAALWLDETLNRRRGLGLILGTLGVIALVGLSPGTLSLPVLLGVAACTGATLCYALTTTWLKRCGGQINALPLTAASLLVAEIALLPLLPAHPPSSVWSMTVIGAVLAIALVCSAIAYLLYFRLIADVGPTRTLSVAFLIPAFGVLWGAIFLDEPVGLATVIGGGLVLLAVRLVTRR